MNYPDRGLYAQKIDRRELHYWNPLQVRQYQQDALTQITDFSIAMAFHLGPILVYFLHLNKWIHCVLEFQCRGLHDVM
jgi:hypothetical protein